MHQQIAISWNLMEPKTEVSVGESEHFFFANHKKCLRYIIFCAKILTIEGYMSYKKHMHAAVNCLINYHRDAAVVWLISRHKFLFIGVISWEKLLNFTWLCQWTYKNPSSP